MKRLMVFVVSLAFLFCASAFAADKKPAADAKAEPAAAEMTKETKAEKKAPAKKATKATKAKKEKKEKKSDEKPAEAPAK